MGVFSFLFWIGQSWIKTLGNFLSLPLPEMQQVIGGKLSKWVELSSASCPWIRCPHLKISPCNSNIEFIFYRVTAVTCTNRGMNLPNGESGSNKRVLFPNANSQKKKKRFCLEIYFNKFPTSFPHTTYITLLHSLTEFICVSKNCISVIW